MKPEQPKAKAPDRSGAEHLTNADAGSNNNGKMQFVQMNPMNSKYKDAQQTNQIVETKSVPKAIVHTRQPDTVNSQMSALERLKVIQAEFKKEWQGIPCEVTGRPGTSNLCNANRTFKQLEKLAEEDLRTERFNRIFATLNNIERDYPLLIQIQGTGSDVKAARSQTNFFQKQKLDTPASVESYLHNFEIVQPNKLQTIKPITNNQLLHNLPPTHQLQQKSYHIDNSEMLYKLMKGDTKLVRSLLEANQFNHTESHEWNILWSSSSCKSFLYEGLNEFQRINHFPMSYEITRKDRLCFNYCKAQEKFGAAAFDFIPDTYILPNEFNEFHAHYLKIKQQDPKRNAWIVKPANSSRGRGIYIIEDVNDLNIDELSVISRYIANPLLINGHKFDLRVYVVVTSYEPLRVYVYKEGLARFASELYSTKANKNNKFMHLTNYSINKKNENFVANDNIENDDVGFKWSLTAFCNHLEQVGIDMDLLWSRIYDLIIKTIACGEHYVIAAMKKNNMFRLNCFEVFGFDILVDSDLKPWVIEVNLSPSLATDAPLDMVIKTNLLTDTFNMCGVRRFDRRKESLNKLKVRTKAGTFAGGIPAQGSGQGKSKMYQINTSCAGSIPLPSTGSQEIWVPNFQLNPQAEYLVNRLSEDYSKEYEKGLLREPMQVACSLKFRDIIAETCAEYSRRGEFVRIYPARNSKIYDKYFASGRNCLNKIIYKVLFSNEVLPYGLQPKITIQPALTKQNSSQLLIKKEEMRPIRTAPVKERLNSSTGVRPPVRQAQTLLQVEEKASQPIEESKSNVGKHSINSDNKKVMITGDDILIEYVSRLVDCLGQQLRDDLIDNSQVKAMERFITHYVWHQPDQINPQTEQALKLRMQNRLNEMTDRRRRLIKYMFKKESRLQDFEKEYPETIDQKKDVTGKFGALQLEELLNNSTKNVAQEVVTCLIPNKGEGVLCILEMQNKRLK